MSTLAALFDQGKYPEALHAAERVIQICGFNVLPDPKHASAVQAATLFAAKAVCVSKLVSLDSALPIFAAAAAWSPSHAPVHFNWGLCLLNSGRLYDAVAKLKQAVACDGAFLPALRGLVEAYSQLQTEQYFADAVDAINAFCMAHAPDTSLLLQKGYCCLRLQRWAEACNAYRGALASSGGRSLPSVELKDIKAMFCVALTQHATEMSAKGDNDTAVELFREAVSVDPTIGRRFNYGKALTESGDFVAAVDALKAVVREAPDHIEAQALLGSVLLRQGQRDDAIPALEAAIAAANRALTSQAAVRFTNAGRFVALSSKLRCVTSQDGPPDQLLSLYTTACVNLAVGLEESGNYEGAAAAIQKALGVDPSHARALAIMDVISAALDPSTAAKYLTPIPAPKPPSPEPVVVEAPAPPPAKAVVPKWQQQNTAAKTEPPAARWQSPATSGKVPAADTAPAVNSSKPESPSPALGNRWQPGKGSAVAPTPPPVVQTPSEPVNRWKSSAVKAEIPASDPTPGTTESPLNRWRTSSKDKMPAPAPAPALAPPKEEAPVSRWKAPAEAVKPAPAEAAKLASDEPGKTPSSIAARWQKPTPATPESTEPQLASKTSSGPVSGTAIGGGLKPATPGPGPATPKWQAPSKVGESASVVKPPVVSSTSPQPLSKPALSSPLARQAAVSPSSAPSGTASVWFDMLIY